MTSKNALARSAGLLYLVLAACGGFSELYVRTGARDLEDPAAIARHVAEHETLFRVGFATDLVSIACFLLAGLAFYALLRSVNGTAAVAMLAFNAVAVAIIGANLVNHAGALLTATGAAGTPMPGASPALFLELHGYGYTVAQVFFGLFLLPLGYLVLRSGLFPRALGLVVMAGCLSYLVGVPLSLAAPDAGSALPVWLPAAVAELSLTAWLLVKGVRTGGGAGSPVTPSAREAVTAPAGHKG